MYVNLIQHMCIYNYKYVSQNIVQSTFKKVHTINTTTHIIYQLTWTVLFDYVYKERVENGIKIKSC